MVDYCSSLFASRAAPDVTGHACGRGLPASWLAGRGCLGYLVAYRERALPTWAETLSSVLQAKHAHIQGWEVVGCDSSLSSDLTARDKQSFHRGWQAPAT